MEPHDTPDYRQAMSNWVQSKALIDSTGLSIAGHQVMQEWERPIMLKLADLATPSRGDVMEVGYGLGICTEYILARQPRSLTIVEAHPDLARMARERTARQDVSVSVVEGFWQDQLPLSGTFDGIVFDTYPLVEDERSRNHFPFIQVASEHLRDGGRLTYYSDEHREFRADHLALLLQHFSEVSLHVVDDLCVPSHCNYWDHDHMVIPCAQKL
jgi:guanidinoacetate N-methyltransferase